MARKMKTMDGNKAAAYVSYAFTDVAAIYPITPSSNMAEHADEWAANGMKNLFGQPVKVVEMQSEAGAAGAMHGSLAAGALTTSYTASQGLLLMIPNMYKMAGEFLPGVLHVTARTIATHALSIFGDHSDVMACTQTGFAMLASSSVQEVMDIGGVAHLSAIRAGMPFLHFFDGFRTSHEQQKIEVIEYEEFEPLLDKEALERFRNNALNPEHPVLRGTNQNPDIFFQAREACSLQFEAIPDIVEDYLGKISKLTGREYHLFNYYGDPEAEEVVICMGSVAETAGQAVAYLNAQGRKTGCLNVHLYRPFAVDYFLSSLPKSVKRIAVLDRCKTPGSPGEPLYLDIVKAFSDQKNIPLIIGGRYGLSSKDTVPADIIAVFDNLATAVPKNNFTISINDDLCNSSLPSKEAEDLLPEGTIQCKFWGFGSDGTVGANKQAVDIIGEYTDMYAQAYFSYDSKKSGGVTVSHLRFGKKPIPAPYLIKKANFISCSNQSYVDKYDLLAGLEDGGSFLLNCVWGQDQLEEKLPASIKRYLAVHKINFYIINAVQIAKDLGLGNRTNMVMQAAFFKLANVIPLEMAVGALNDSIVKAYGKKGAKVVDMNKQAVQAGLENLVKVDIPANWDNVNDQKASAQQFADLDQKFVEDIMNPMIAFKGDDVSVSAFDGRGDGTFPLNTARYEKRGVASFVPQWLPENCIQCNQCSFICPHACIRPFLITEEEVASAPKTEEFIAVKAVGKKYAGYFYRMQVSPLDCQGCGACVVTCPAKNKALVMQPIEEQTEKQAENWDFAVALPSRSCLTEPATVKDSQFFQPYYEFSGSCAGCGETPYMKLITQLFGDRMMIANATGCSSIWGGPVPANPFCTDREGKGPAWCNSLFEDCAEFGFGMLLGAKQIRVRLAALVNQALEGASGELADAYRYWLEQMDSGEGSKAATARLLPLLEKSSNPLSKQIYAAKDHLIKKSFWAFGGDGWAYDIGYGGVDHVLASGEDINVFVFDTEVYSNTGGQSSKATPTAAIAKFAASGKRTRKKDLGRMAMTYGDVYVTQIAMGADMNQTLKALREAESYPGPSLIIAYSTCINHGIKGGMANTMVQMKRAVEAGYWHLYRYNPLLEEKGENPFVFDSKEPSASFREFIESEVRYSALLRQFPEAAEELFAKTEKDAKDRYAAYKFLAGK